MSQWKVRVIERLGTPSLSWPSIFGPALVAAGADPVAANGLHTLDLSGVLAPLEGLEQSLERDLTKASMGTIQLDMVDPTGSLATSLGPFSSTMATASRYFGPWVEITESWAGNSYVRFLGVLDESSLEWSEDEGHTLATVMHATQILRERTLADFPEILRPFPSTPDSVDHSFTATTADDALNLFNPSLISGTPFVPRGNKLALEQAMWATGKMTWCAYNYRAVFLDNSGGPDVGGTSAEYNYPTPSLPAPRVQIGGQTFPVAGLTLNPTIGIDDFQYSERMNLNGVSYGSSMEFWYGSLTLQLVNADGSVPDLRPLLAIGTTVTFTQAELERTHYLTAAAIAAPAAGADGQTYVQLDLVDQITPGDDLEITFTDTSTTKPSLTTLGLRVVDLDAEQNKTWVDQPISQAVPLGAKVRRNSTDPVQVDAVDFATTFLAPFPLDTSRLLPAVVGRPTLSWIPYTLGNPHLYGVVDMQVADNAGTLRMARRGPTGADGKPVSGVWSGTVAGGFNYLGLGATPDATLPLKIMGDPNQWPAALPGGVTAVPPPTVWVRGDMSAGATAPPNGWRAPNRSLPLGSDYRHPIFARWDGTEITWGSYTPGGGAPVLPPKMLQWVATNRRGLYQLQGTTWTFTAQTNAATTGLLDGTPTVVTPTGTLPTGGAYFKLGMGILKDATLGHREGLVGLYGDGAAFPFTKVRATIFDVSGGVAANQTVTLWDNTSPDAAGQWTTGGGLVLTTWNETINGNVFPRTRLWLVDGRATPLVLDLPGVEILPDTIQPLLVTGTGATRAVSGWVCLALETVLGDNLGTARKSRFIWMDASLKVVNGDLEPSCKMPNDPRSNFKRGEVLAEIIPPGSIAAKMIRTSTTTDAMVGFIGGRIFQVDDTLSRNLDRVRIDSSTTAVDVLDAIGAALLATAVPMENGGFALVSRTGGTPRPRVDPLYTGTGLQNMSGVFPAEWSKVSILQSARAFVSSVRVGYSDLLTDTAKQVAVNAPHLGGKPFDLDLSMVLSSPVSARSIGQAVAFYMGRPARVRTEEWRDLTGGAAASQAPPWWASYRVGDLIPYDQWNKNTTGTITTWKLVHLRHNLENRTAAVELVQLPDAVSIGGTNPWQIL